MALTAEQINFYKDNGYIVVADVLAPEEMDTLHARLKEIVATDAPPPGVKFQVEPSIAKGETVAASKEDSYRKIWDLIPNDEVYTRVYATNPRVVGVIHDVLGTSHIKLFRDALMCKPARHGSQKVWHQDSLYWRIEPMALCSCWLALDDATPENGCMRVIPGSHKWGPIAHSTVEGDFGVEATDLDLSNEVVATMKAGSALFFHSLLFHGTAPNTSDRHRRAMICSYMRGDSRWVGEGDEPDWFVVSE